MDLGLDGQVILVTGSSRGIGQAIAREFLRERAKVIITGREITSLNHTMQELRDEFPDSIVNCYHGDLSDDSVIREAAVFIQNKFGVLDHLVCNIGNGQGPLPLNETQEDWDRLLNTNLLCTVGCVREMLHLIKPAVDRTNVSPSIALIGSICGIENFGAPTAYSAAKAAVIAYAKSISVPLGHDGIRINVVSPGNVVFSGSVWESKLRENKEKVMNMLNAQVPLRRLGNVEEISSIITFLASRRASFVTAANWIVDGGQTRRF